MLFGRDRELQQLQAILVSARAGVAQRLVVRGEPGSGKTALISEFGRRAVDSGFLTASTAGHEPTETSGATKAFSVENAFAGHADLFGGWIDLVGDQLDDDQLRVLRTTVTGVWTDGQPPTPRLIAAATLSLCSAVAAQQPALLLVDDAHWLDQPTLAVLEFVSRRVSSDAIALVATVRLGSDEIVGRWGASSLDLAGLDRQAGTALLRISRPVSADVGERCVGATRGNPLELLELARVLSDDQLVGRESLPDPLPIAGRMYAGLEAEVAALPRDVRTVLCIAAADERNTIDTVIATADRMGISPATVEVAEALGLFDTAFGQVRWRHPMWRSVAYGSGLQVADQRTVHHHLACATSDPRRRVMHRFRGSIAQSEELAHELRSAADDARRFGALEVAGDVYEMAASRSPVQSDQVDLWLLAGECFLRAGSLGRAQSALLRAGDLSESHNLPEMLMPHLVKTEMWLVGPASAAATAAKRAVVAATDDRRALLLCLAAVAEMLAGRVGQVRDLAAQACEASEVNDVTALVRDAVLGCGLMHCGERAASHKRLTTVRPVLDVLMRDAEVAEQVETLVYFVASADITDENYDQARSDLQVLLATGHRAGFETGFGSVLLADLLWRTGRWAAASSTARDVADKLADTDLRAQSFLAKAILARSEAGYGYFDAADSLASEAFEYGRRDEVKGGVTTSWALSARALSAVGRGDHHGVVRTLIELRDQVRAWGSRHPGSIWWQGDLIESLVLTRDWRAADELDRLREDIDLIQSTDPSDFTGRRWATAVWLRGMSLRPGSNLKRCVEDLEMSVELLEELSCPFEKWRSVAELGTALIRYGHEDDGRRKVVEAVRGFETLGARPWADRIRGQLLGGEPARQAPSLRTVLSPAELRVAVAIASGDDGPLEVKKIAELLYVSPKTVEFHLTNIYRKASLASGAKLRDRVRAEEGLAPESLGAGREASHDNG